MKKNLSSFLCLAICSLAPASFAQTLWWDGGTVNITTNGDGLSQGSAGTWNNTIQNWDQGSGLAHVTWTSGDNAFFGGAAGTITLGAAVTATTVTITNKGYGFTDGGTSTYTLTVSTITNSTGGGTGTPTIFTNNIVSSSLSIWGANSDVRLDAANASLTGTLSVNQGTVEIGDGTVYNGGFGSWNGAIASGATLAIRNDVNNTVVATVFSGQGTLQIANKSGVSTILTGNSILTGSTVIASGGLIVDTIDDVNPNPLGTGPLQVGNNASSATFNYQGSTAFTTTRPLVLGGNGASIITGLSGEAIIFNGPFLFGPNITAASKTLELTGAGYTDQGLNTIACSLTNYGAVPLIVNKQSGTWVLAGSNSFSGGVTFTGSSSGALFITNDSGLGVSNGGIFLTNGSGAITSTNANVTIGASRTVDVITNVTFSTSDTNNLTVASYITGTGWVTKGSASYTLGVVRFSNDTNNFSGNFAMGFGNTEFTSVADAGVPCSLGAGGYITNNNSSSFGIFRYVGIGNSATHRPLVWAASTGTLALDNTNTGTIAYLSPATLTSTAGSKTLMLQGSNTGTNTLAQMVNDDGGSTSLIKSGTGEWLLTGANTYSGATTVGGGTLLVNGSLAGSVVTVTNGILGGSGTIGGPVTVTNTGTLAAGDPASMNVATLTINNSVTNYATIFIKLNKSAAASDKIISSGALVYGGTLSLTNLSGTLVTNDSFQIFSAASYPGAFSSIVPATPGPGLAWNTNNLAINGTIGITAGVVKAPPVITSIVLNGTYLTIQGTNGVANGSFVLLTTTNIALPLGQWTPLLSNSFDGSGDLNLTTNLNMTTNQQFFILSQ